MQLPWWVPSDRSRLLDLRGLRVFIAWCGTIVIWAFVLVAEPPADVAALAFGIVIWLADTSALIWYLRLPIRRNSRCVRYPQNVTQTMADLRLAFARVGRVVKSNTTSHTMTGKCRYGLGSMKLRVALSADAGGTTIEIRPVGDDVESSRAWKATERLLRALDELEPSE